MEEDSDAVVVAQAEAGRQSSSNSSLSHSTHIAQQHQASRVLAVLILLSMIPKSASTGVELWSEPQPLRLDATLVSGALMVGLILLLILGWELLRWAGLQTYDRLGPGSSLRRLQRLQRLRDNGQSHRGRVESQGQSAPAGAAAAQKSGGATKTAISRRTAESLARQIEYRRRQ